MVYIIQCEFGGLSSKKGELEACRQEFAKQIRQGVLLLPVGFRLVEVVKTDSIIDVEIIKDQTKAAEQVYVDQYFKNKNDENIRYEVRKFCNEIMLYAERIEKNVKEEK